jgi:hypothetical protein
MMDELTTGGLADVGLADPPVLMCTAHPDDCPRGPDPHPFVPPAWDGIMCCSRQPWEDATPMRLADVPASRVILTLISRLGGVPQTVTAGELAAEGTLMSQQNEDGSLTLWAAS